MYVFFVRGRAYVMFELARSLSSSPRQLQMWIVFPTEIPVHALGSGLWQLGDDASIRALSVPEGFDAFSLLRVRFGWAHLSVPPQKNSGWLIRSGAAWLKSNHNSIMKQSSPITFLTPDNKMERLISGGTLGRGMLHFLAQQKICIKRRTGRTHCGSSNCFEMPVNSCMQSSNTHISCDTIPCILLTV